MNVHFIDFDKKDRFRNMPWLPEDLPETKDIRVYNVPGCPEGKVKHYELVGYEKVPVYKEVHS